MSIDGQEITEEDYIRSLVNFPIYPKSTNNDHQRRAYEFWLFRWKREIRQIQYVQRMMKKLRKRAARANVSLTLWDVLSKIEDSRHRAYYLYKAREYAKQQLKNR